MMANCNSLRLPSTAIQKMLVRILVAHCLFLASLALASASPFSDAATLLDGTWRGGDFILRIDAKRAQASVDADRPFAWKQFLIKEAAPGDIVFAVGADIYEARVEADTLTLTGTSFRGARVLMREAALRGPVAE